MFFVPSDLIKIFRRGKWVTVFAENVAGTDERRGRCVECGHPAIAYRKSSLSQAVRVKHVRKNESCSLSRWPRSAGFGSTMECRRCRDLQAQVVHLERIHAERLEVLFANEEPVRTDAYWRLKIEASDAKLHMDLVHEMLRTHQRSHQKTN